MGGLGLKRKFSRSLARDAGPESLHVSESTGVGATRTVGNLTACRPTLTTPGHPARNLSGTVLARPAGRHTGDALGPVNSRGTPSPSLGGSDLEPGSETCQ